MKTKTKSSVGGDGGSENDSELEVCEWKIDFLLTFPSDRSAKIFCETEGRRRKKVFSHRKRLRDNETEAKSSRDLKEKKTFSLFSCLIISTTEKHISGGRDKKLK